MTRFKGRRDGPGGRNEHYDIGSRKIVPLRKLVEEIKRREHPGAQINGREHVRDNRDSSTANNVIRK
jgi:hypothetical protein